MSDVIDRPVLEQEPSANSRLRIIDCDIHPSLHSRADLNPFLSKRWQDHLKTYGDHLRTPYIGTTPYPRSSPLIARRDAWPPTGGPPGSDLAFMRKQHLDPFDVEFGILQVLDLFIFSQQNLDFGAAIQRAINEWQLANWSSREPRLKASILVGQDDTEAAIAEIERCAKLGQYVQINVSPRANEPLGRHRYWPIYARAEELGLPVGIHVGGYGGHAPTGGGWPSYYAEEHQSNAHTVAATLEFGYRRRAGALPAAEDRVHRGRIRVDLVDDVANGPAFRTLPQRGAASQAASVRIRAGAFLVHDPADRRAGRGAAPAIPDRMGRRRSPAVLVGLSALGFRRSALRVQDAAERNRTRENLQRQRAGALQTMIP